MGYHLLRDSAICASVIVRDLGAGVRVLAVVCRTLTEGLNDNYACRKLLGSLFGREFDSRHLHFNKTDTVPSYFVSVARSLNRWRRGKVVCIRWNIAAQYLILVDDCFPNKFEACIIQNQQSAIVSTSLALLKPAAVTRLSTK